MVTSQVCIKREIHFTYPCICKQVDCPDIVILFTKPSHGIVLNYQGSKISTYKIGSDYSASDMRNFIPLSLDECIELRNI